MAGVSQDTYSLLESKIVPHKQALYSNPNCLVDLYLRNVFLVIRTPAFDRTARQDLLQYYIDRDCLIPIGQLFAYQTQQRSLKHFLTMQEMRERVYWQIVLRLVKLKINCLKELKQQIKTLTKEVVKLISTLRMVLEQRIPLLKNMVASAFNYVLKENCPTLFFDKARLIFRLTQLNLEYVLQDAKRRIIQQLMGDIREGSKIKEQAISKNDQSAKKGHPSLCSYSSTSLKDKTPTKSQEPAIKKQSVQSSIKKQPKVQASLLSKLRVSRVSRAQRLMGTSPSPSSHIKLQQIVINSQSHEESKRSSSRYIKADARRSSSRESFTRTLYSQTKQNQIYIPERRQSIHFNAQYVNSKAKHTQAQQPKPKSKRAHEPVSARQQARIRDLITIHYEKREYEHCG